MEFDWVVGCGLGWFVGPKFLLCDGLSLVGSVVWRVGWGWKNWTHGRLWDAPAGPPPLDCFIPTDLSNEGHVTTGALCTWFDRYPVGWWSIKAAVLDSDKVDRQLIMQMPEHIIINSVHQSEYLAIKMHKILAICVNTRAFFKRYFHAVRLIWRT